MRTALTIVGLVVSVHAAPAKARTSGPSELAALTRRIPARAPNAMTGSRFADSVEHLDAADRERAIRREIEAGNIPPFLRTLVPVQMTGRDGQSMTIFVMPDYLAIGSDEDFLRIPMNLETASAVADAFGFTLPTRKMVNAIYGQSGHHFVPEPLPPGPRMTSTDYYRTHNALVERQARDGRVPLGTLVSGHKKDVVLTNLLARNPARIAIYGWHRPTGAPIQPLSTVHGACYEDYSHGIRLVADLAWQDGEFRPLRELLQDPATAPLLSDEGALRVVDPAPTVSCGAPAHAAQ
jgi:hypothetical protein